MSIVIILLKEFFCNRKARSLQNELDNNSISNRPNCQYIFYSSIVGCLLVECWVPEVLVISRNSLARWRWSKWRAPFLVATWQLQVTWSALTNPNDETKKGFWRRDNWQMQFQKPVVFPVRRIAINSSLSGTCQRPRGRVVIPGNAPR